MTILFSMERKPHPLDILRLQRLIYDMLDASTVGQTVWEELASDVVDADFSVVTFYRRHMAPLEYINATFQLEVE